MMVALTLLIDYFRRSYYILLIILLSYSWFLLFNISRGCGLVGTAAAFAVSVSIVCMYALLSLGHHFVLSFFI